MHNEKKQAQTVAKWVLEDNFAALEIWESENGSITFYLDDMWDHFSSDSKMEKLLEKAYLKWVDEN